MHADEVPEFAATAADAQLDACPGHVTTAPGNRVQESPPAEPKRELTRTAATCGRPLDARVSTRTAHVGGTSGRRRRRGAPRCHRAVGPSR